MNLLPLETVDAIYSALGAGASTRQICQSLDVAKNTVAGYRRLWLAAGNELPVCECGRRSDHKMWCAPRFARHPRRQKTMRDLRARQRNALL